MELRDSIAISYVLGIFWLVFAVYSHVGWRFKLYPALPFLGGMLLLIAFMWWYYYEVNLVKDLSNSIKECLSNQQNAPLLKCTPQVAATLIQLREAAEFMLKLLEVICFPFAVFLLVFAIQTKVDKESLNRRISFDEKLCRLRKKEGALLKKIDARMKLFEEKGEPSSVLALHREINSLQMQIIDDKFDLDDQFPEFSKLIDPSSLD